MTVFYCILGTAAPCLTYSDHGNLTRPLSPASFLSILHSLTAAADRAHRFGDGEFAESSPMRSCLGHAVRKAMLEDAGGSDFLESVWRVCRLSRLGLVAWGLLLPRT